MNERSESLGRGSFRVTGVGQFVALHGDVLREMTALAPEGWVVLHERLHVRNGFYIGSNLVFLRELLYEISNCSAEVAEVLVFVRLKKRVFGTAQSNLSVGHI